MEEEVVVEEKGLVGKYFDSLTGDLLNHMITGAVVGAAVRRIDTNIIRDQLGQNALESFKDAAPLGRIPLVNA